MSVADDFRAAVKLMAFQPPGHSARSVGVPQDAPNFSAKGLSGSSVPEGFFGGQSGLGAVSQGVGAIGSAVKAIGSIFA